MSTNIDTPKTKLSSADKKALLAKKLQERKQKIGARQMLTIPRRDTSSPAPLTHTQEGVWYIEQLQPDTATYNISSAWRLYGKVDESALQQSLNTIVQRHESLRTHFVQIDGQPMQVITPDLEITLDVVDLQRQLDAESEDQIEKLVAETARTPFDLTQAPLLRAKLFRLGAEDQVFVVTMHHIISDGWSFQLFQNELAKLYNAFYKQHPMPNLPELPIQYADFAAYQRQQIENDNRNADLEYWRQQLTSAPPVLELPTDFTRPAIQSYDGDRIRKTLSPDLTAALKKLGQQENVTLFMTLLTTFKIILQRYSGQDDIVVGTPMVNRSQVEIENLIGYFLNNLVLRTDLSNEPTFLELLRRVRSTTLDAYGHQSYPFEKLVQELQPERNLSHTPLFQVFFNLFNAFEDQTLELADLTVESITRSQDDTRSKFDMTVYVKEKKGKIQLDLVYSTALFGRERMETMLDQYEQLLTEIVAQPDQPIATFSLVTPSTETILPSPTEPLDDAWQGAVHNMFSAQAKQHPHQIAVEDPQLHWTYQELDETSNQLAHYLKAKGIQTGDVVAIYSHRSASTILTWLGILKAGAAFINLDPAYPVDRLVNYLNTGQPKGLIRIEAAEALPAEIEEWIQDLPIGLTMPQDKMLIQSELLGEYPSTDLDVELGANDLAYIAFTSGSTGQPKGIYGLHGALSHFLPWQMERFEIQSRDRFSLLSGLPHDAFQRDIFTALWAGGTIVIPDPEQVGSPGYLGTWMKQQRISFSNLTPPMCQLLFDTTPSGELLSDLRRAFFVGEELTQHHIAQLRKVAPNVACFNLYGTTETQRALSYYPIPEGPASKSVYPLGQGMPGCQLLILNQNMQLAGVGETGEIYFRSHHLAQGYVDDERMTSEKFIPNPLTDIPGDRLYRTGDLGRYRSDGVVEFVGRADRQIKIRGFRIEPGEIETTLTQHSAVQQAIVVAFSTTGQSDKKYLAAYIIPAKNQTVEIDELKRFVGERLPNYMIPTVFMTVEAVPLTPSGKVDFRALPTPDLTLLDQGGPKVAPRTPEEAKIATIWADTLGLEEIGVTANFFDLGGHSLLAVQLLSRIEKETGQSLSLPILFQAPTVAELTQRVYQAEESANLRSLVPLRTKGSQPPIFCLPGNLGNVFTDLNYLVKHTQTDQPFYGLQDSADNPAKVESLAEHYLEEIKVVQPEGPYFIAGICSGGAVAYEMAQQLKSQGDEVALLALIEPSRPRIPGVTTTLKFAWTMAERFFTRIRDQAETYTHMENNEQHDFARLKRKLFANAWALRRYRIKPYAGQIHLFLTEDSLQKKGNDQTQWMDYAETGGTLYDIPGDHDLITGTGDRVIEEAPMKVLADKLSTCIKTILH